MLAPPCLRHSGGDNEAHRRRRRGISGLTAAALLAARGFAVTVIERQAVPGGKARSVETGGVAVDGGPTVLTMRWVFDELFAACGSDLDGAVQLTKTCSAPVRISP